MNEKIFAYVTRDDNSLDLLEYDQSNPSQQKELLYILFNLINGSEQFKQVTLSKVKL